MDFIKILKDLEVEHEEKILKEQDIEKQNIKNNESILSLLESKIQEIKNKTDYVRELFTDYPFTITQPSIIEKSQIKWSIVFFQKKTQAEIEFLVTPEIETTGSIKLKYKLKNFSPLNVVDGDLKNLAFRVSQLDNVSFLTFEKCFEKFFIATKEILVKFKYIKHYFETIK